jgi:hypothetical protein
MAFKLKEESKATITSKHLHTLTLWHHNCMPGGSWRRAKFKQELRKKGHYMS